MHNIIKIVSILAILSMPLIAYSKDFQQEDKTKTVHKITRDEIKVVSDQEPKQINMLTLSVRTTWEDNIKTVGQAVQYILEPSGYQLVVSYPAPKDALDIARKPIPAVVKINRTMPIIDVIQLLIGIDNTIIIDHEHKLVSFQKGSVK